VEVIPAIDVSGGKVVRLVRGDRNATTVYADDPSAMAARWAASGARRIHVVDIDGAFDGSPRNAHAIAELVRAVDVPVQVGGGIRDLDTARELIDLGVDRVVLGTAALTDDAFLRDALGAWPGRVVVGLDSRERELRVAGWAQGSGLDLVETARKLAALGVPRFLCTDISRDGTLEGPNVALLEEVARESGVPVIASGGVSSLDDLRALARVPGIEAAVVGKALYTGDVSLTEALAV
jgi:phosphoribosylformimino-5-aminoimidazole carboxamide ribotide isomerase